MDLELPIDYDVFEKHVRQHFQGYRIVVVSRNGEPVLVQQVVGDAIRITVFECEDGLFVQSIEVIPQAALEDEALETTNISDDELPSDLE